MGVAIPVRRLRGMRLVHELPRLIADPLRALGDGIARGAGIVDYRFAGRSAVVVNDAALAHEVLTSKGTFVKPSLGARFTLWFGPDGLPAPKDFRQLAVGGFARSRIAMLAPEIDRAVAMTLPRLDYHAMTDRPVDVTRLGMRLSLLASGRALFGADLRTDAQRIEDALEEIQSYYARQGLRIALGVRDFIRTPASRGVRIAAAELRAVVARLITARVARSDVGEDLLGVLLRNCRGRPSMTRTMLENIAMSALLSSFETTGCALSWSLVLLNEHPQHARRVAAEADGLPDGALDTARALGATYTSKVFGESLRLYPPSWIIVRETRGAACIGRHEVPAGTTVLISPYWVHRDERRWPDATAFDPERFAEDAPAPVPGSYLPFGDGPHSCFGERFARLVAQVVLLRVLGRYEVRRGPGGLPEPQALISLRPGRPVDVRLVLRQP